MPKPIQKTLRITFDANHAKMQRRARQFINRLVEKKTFTHSDIADILQTTVDALLDGSTQPLTSEQFTLLQSEFNCSMLWLWYGYGPMIIDKEEIKQLNASLA